MADTTDTTLPQWYYDLADRSRASGIVAASQAKSATVVPQVIQTPKSKHGTSTQSANQKETRKTKAHEDNLKVKRAWEVALAPVKSLPMNLIMSYFSGNGLQMVTIMMTFYMYFMSPFKQLMALSEVFHSLEGSDAIKNDIRVTKLVYIMSHLVMVAAGVWKVGQMGLLPNHESDWLSFESPTIYLQKAIRA